MTQTLLLGGVEAGGTKFVCGVADGDGRILEQVRVATTTPDETLAAVDAFFARTAAAHGPLAALGVCSFGPLSLRPDAPDYGAITTTPKPGWSGANLLSHLRRTADTPTVLTTDVNGSAVGERLFGSGRGLDSFCYVTVGTGSGWA